MAPATAEDPAGLPCGHTGVWHMITVTSGIVPSSGWFIFFLNYSHVPHCQLSDHPRWRLLLGLGLAAHSPWGASLWLPKEPWIKLLMNNPLPPSTWGTWEDHMGCEKDSMHIKRCLCLLWENKSAQTDIDVSRMKAAEKNVSCRFILRGRKPARSR